MLLSVALTAALLAAMTPEQRSRNIESFDYVWTTIRDKHWSMPAGLDWDKVRDELRPKVETATSASQARTAMLDMIGRLKQSHFNIGLPPVFGHCLSTQTRPEDASNRLRHGD